MNIASKTVHEVLVENGVDHIYHANSVMTACQFLRHGSLMSRGTIERKRLFQTPQKSDGIDRKYGIWFDVFADAVDIHHWAKKPNVYGPVLFVLDVKVIAEAGTGGVWLSKLNPTKWKGKSREERWFTSAADLKQSFVKGQLDQMILFRHCGGEVPFKDYLKKVILDDPKLPAQKETDEVDYYSMAFGALRLSMTEGSFEVPIRKRICPEKCTCTDRYQANKERTKKLYWPKM